MPEIQEVLPKYLQIAAYIRDQIIRGDLQPDEEVPSERALASTWKVARPTATKALEALRVQGFVASRRGSGTYVLPRGAAPRARERYERAKELGTMYSEAESVEFVAVELVAGPEQVTQALHLPSGVDVIRRSRLIRNEDAGPIELSTSWFPGEFAEVAPQLLVGERLRGGTAKYIASVTGSVPSYARDEVAARLASAGERRQLQLSRPAAVLIYRLTVYDSTDEPMQFDESTYPPDLWAFRQEYPLSHA